MIDAGADVNMTDEYGRTALFYAVQQRNNENVVRALIDAGADINMTDMYGATALFYSVQQSNNDNVVHVLIDAGADVNTTDENGMTSLFYAVQQTNNENVVRALIDAGADVTMTDKDERASLFYAAKQNNENVIRALIDAGADVQMKDKDGKNALFNAAQFKKKSGVRALIDAGADVNMTDKDGSTALFYAVQQINKENLVRAMIYAGADVQMTDRDGMTAFFYATQFSEKSVVRDLIDACADVNMTDKDGGTVLFYADQQSNKDNVVRALIDAGAEVNITDEGWTALFYAVQQSNNESVVRALTDAGADVNMINKYGRTALFYVSQQSNNESVVRALIDAGADVNMTDEEGTTALLYATQFSNESLVRALIGAGADVNMTDKYKKTALFYSAKENNESVVRALIDAGADVNMTDKDGRTVLTLILLTVPQINESVVCALIDSIDVRDKYGRIAHFYVNLENPSPLSWLLEGGNRYLKLEDNCNVDIVSFLIQKRLGLYLNIPFDYFKDEILDVFAKHGMKRERFIKAIMNVLFLISFFIFKENFNNSFLDQEKFKFHTVWMLHSEYIGDDSLERKAKMKSILKASKNNFPNITEALKLLVELGADPDSADTDGNTVLHHITHLPLLGVPQETVMDLCNELKRLGANFNKRNHERQTALLFCLSADMRLLAYQVLFYPEFKTLVQVCMFLVKQGPSMDETSRSGESVFHLIIKFFERCLKVKDVAIRKDVLQEANKLLQLFPPWKVAKENIINKPDVHINSPLHLWASLSLPSHQDYAGSVTREDHTFKSPLEEILKYLLECGAKVNARNENDETPLHVCKTWTAIKLLLDAGANPNDADSSGRPPLLVAARNETFYKKQGHSSLVRSRPKFDDAEAKEKAFPENFDNFYPDVKEEPKVFWKTAVQMELDPWKADKNDESVLNILVESENFVLSKALVDVACEEGYTKSEKIAIPLLNAICKDRSTRTHWKTALVENILKSRECPTTASTPLRHCCINIIETDVFNKSFLRNKDLAVEKSANETPTTEKETERKLQTSSASYNSVHCENANLLRSYGADIENPDSSGQSCLDVAEDYPALKDFLTKPLDINAVPIVIPWTSTSAKYENRMAKVARRQECKMVDQIWYHKDHIGSGSFGYIFAGINEKDGREVAMKRIEKLRMQRPEDKREVKNLTALADCEQVVRYISFFEDEHFSYVSLELMEGNLEEYLNGSSTDATQATLLCKDVVMGLKFLHEQKILHRDLKPQNILYKIHPKLCLKIADFGLSRIIDCVSTTVYGTHAGTRCWIAPEVFKSKMNKVDKNCFAPASDMFSCGLVLHYILSGQKHPFNPTNCANKSEMQIAHETEDNIMKGKLEGWDYSLSPEATHLVKRMLESIEKDRPSAEEALEHPLFWSNEKKVDFLKAVGNQKEFEWPRSKRTPPLTPVEADVENSFGSIVRHGSWNDPGYLCMPDIYTEMKKGKGRKSYDTSSVVELVRFIRNVYEHYREKMFVLSTPVTTVTPVTIEQMLFDDFVFLEYFPDLVMEVYKAVTTHGWDQTRDDIKSTMNKK